MPFCGPWVPWLFLVCHLLRWQGGRRIASDWGTVRGALAGCAEYQTAREVVGFPPDQVSGVNPTDMRLLSG